MSNLHNLYKESTNTFAKKKKKIRFLVLVHPEA